MIRPFDQHLSGILGLILCISLLAAVTFGTFLLFPAHIHYHIEEKYLFSSDESDAIVHLGILIPKSGPYQEVKNIKISWDGAQERENRQSVEVIKLTGDDLQGKIQEAVISYDVILPKGEIYWEVPIEDFQLLPQREIESGHPLIKEQVSKITTGSSLDDVFRIFVYTSDYLIYSLGERDCTSSSALTAFLTHTGVCGEFARLMVAFSRASGVPAQVISGILLPDLLILGSSQTQIQNHPSESHAWVEFYTDGRWTMADPAVGSGQLNSLQFGKNDGRHLSYGEFEQEGIVFAEMKDGLSDKGKIIGSEFGVLKYIASANTSRVSISPKLFIKKGWDGRWVNTLVLLTLSTYILCKLRNRLIQQETIPRTDDISIEVIDIDSQSSI